MNAYGWVESHRRWWSSVDRNERVTIWSIGIGREGQWVVERSYLRSYAETLFAGMRHDHTDPDPWAFFSGRTYAAFPHGWDPNGKDEVPQEPV